jgi:hypothetical protein
VNADKGKSGRVHRSLSAKCQQECDNWQYVTQPPGIQWRGRKGNGEPPELKGDAIMAIKTESASGLIYWNGSKFEWCQQGD